MIPYPQERDNVRLDGIGFQIFRFAGLWVR